MNHQTFKGFALILFGLLLCAGGAEINQTILRSFSDFPFALLGVISGIAGLIMIFRNNPGDPNP